MRAHTVAAWTLATSLATFAFTARGVEVAGGVLDQHGAPLEGATVVASPWRFGPEGLLAFIEGREMAAATARTGADGTYSLSIPKPGLYSIEAEAPGLRPVLLPPSPYLEDRVLEPAKLQPARALEVEVVDEKGAGVAGALIFALVDRRGKSETSFWLPRPTLAMTSRDGTLSVPSEDGEVLHLTVSAAGFVPWDNRVSAAQPPARIELAKGIPVRIRVLGEDRRPLAGALVSSHVPLAVSDARGIAEVTLGGRPLALQISAADGWKGRHTLDPADVATPGLPNRAPIDIQLAPSRRLAGVVVTGTAREPIEGAIVYSERLDMPPSWTGPAGDYQLLLGEATFVFAGAPGYLFASAAVDPEATDAPSLVLEPSGALAGRILDQDGEPVPAASVILQHGGTERRPQILAGHSTVDGTFEFLSVRTDEPLLLTVKAPLFDLYRRPLEALELGEKRRGIEVELEPAPILVGQVVDADDAPVAGAEVRLAHEAPSENKPTDGRSRSRRPREPVTTTADEHGGFVFPDVWPGTYRLRVTAPGFAPFTLPGVEVARGDKTTDIGAAVMLAGVAIEGRVVDPDGAGVQGVRIETFSQQERRSLGLEHAAVSAPVSTDAAGRFRLEDLRPGETLLLLPSAAGWLGMQTKVSPPLQDPLTLVMRRSATVRGRVLDSRHQPVLEAIVSIVASTPGQALDATDSEGRFELEQVPPGVLTFFVRSQRHRELVHGDVRVAPGEVVEDLELVLEDASPLTGTVRDPGGAPVAGAAIAVFGVSTLPAELGDDPAWRGRTDESGRFRCQMFGPASMTVEASHDIWGKVERPVVLPAQGFDLDLQFPRRARVSGQALDAESGEGVWGATVYLESQGDGGTVARTTDQDGLFRFESVADGSWRPTAFAPGYAPGSAAPLEVSGRDVDDLVFEMGPGTRLSGRVAGLTFDDLAVLRVDAWGAGRASARIGSEGDYRFDHLAAGHWVVRAQVDDGRQALGTVLIEPGDEATTLDLDLGAGYTFSGTFKIGEHAVRGGRLEIGDGHNVLVSSDVDAEGRFSMVAIPAGSWQLSYRNGELEFTIPFELEKNLTETDLVVTNAADLEHLLEEQ